jgi:hypothetical protein
VAIGLFGLKSAGDFGRGVTPVWLAGHAFAGALIGCLVALCDGRGPGTLVSRFLALISPATALLPIFGLRFNIAELWFNRAHPGGHRTLSRITFVLALLVSAAVVLLLLTGGRQTAAAPGGCAAVVRSSS